MKDVDPPMVLDHLSVEYRHSAGSSGEQLHVKECPFCGSNGWKLYMNADTGLGNCFAGSCQQRFNMFSFVKAYTSKTPKQVYELLEVISGQRSKPWVTKPRVEKEFSGKLILPETHRHTAEFKRYYTGKRKLSEEELTKYSLYYSHNGHFDYQLGGQGKRLDFSGRLIIPVYDIDNKLVSFQGRDITGKSDQPYLFPPGYPASGRHLYNIQNVVGERQVVICEGVFDCIQVAECGIPAVASFGKSFSNSGLDDQMSQLLKLKAAGLKSVVIMWDGDDDSVARAVSTGLTICTYGLQVKIAFCESGMDPDDMDPSEIRAAVKNSMVLNRLTSMRIKSSAYRKYNQG